MTVLNVSGLSEALADERILEPDQYEEFIHGMLSHCHEVPILARELVYRGWLTPFQIERIIDGQVHTLIVGSYVLLEPLGEGGMGRVYRARNWKLDRIVALKIIRDEQAWQPAAIGRFRREIRVLARIRHPNIVMAIDADFRPGAIFYAMEYVEGIDLGRLVRERGPLSIRDACDYMMQTADALQHAHKNGLIHRDLKPSNLFLAEPDRTIKLLDLGLTRTEVPIDDSVFIELTRAGALIGTPDFMSPEQIKDSHGTDIRSDLYSLGCTFYYLLAGAAPFEHIDAIVDKLRAQCDAEPTPIEAIRSDLPILLARIVRKLMAKRRRDRFQNPEEFVRELAWLFEGSNCSSWETLVNSTSFTLTDIPKFRIGTAEMSKTEVLAPEEIGLVAYPDDAEADRKANRWRILWLQPAQLAAAILIASLSVLILWRSGIGPGTLGHNRIRAEPNDSMMLPADEGLSPVEAPPRNESDRAATRSRSRLCEAS